MADIDVLPRRGIPFRAVVDASGVSVGGTADIAVLRRRGMEPVCQVDAVGVDVNGSGATIADLQRRGIPFFCLVDEIGVEAFTGATVAQLRARGIPALCALSTSGLALGGTATIDDLRRRGIESFCPVDEDGNGTTVGAGATVEFTASAVDPSDLTTYTFSDQPLGEEAPDRKIVVGVSGRNGTTPNISAITVAGQPATLVVEVISGATLSKTALYIAEVPTGATGDVVVTWTDPIVRCGIGLWATYGISVTAADTGTSTADPATDTLTIPENGFAIGYGFCADGVTHRTATWTGLSEDFDELIETLGFSHTGAHGTSGSISCDWSATPSVGAGVVFASFGPAA